MPNTSDDAYRYEPSSVGRATEPDDLVRCHGCEYRHIPRSGGSSGESFQRFPLPFRIHFVMTSLPVAAKLSMMILYR